MFDVCTTGDTALIDMIFKFLPCTHQHLKTHITAAVKNIDAPTLMRVWQELEHCIDVCRVQAVHTLNISSCQKTNFPVLLWL
jgi:hypothetical protein